MTYEFSYCNFPKPAETEMNPIILRIPFTSIDSMKGKIQYYYDLFQDKAESMSILKAYDQLTSDDIMPSTIPDVKLPREMAVSIRETLSQKTIKNRRSMFVSYYYMELNIIEKFHEVNLRI